MAMISESKVDIFTLKDALKTLSGAKFVYLHVRVDALIKDDAAHCYSGGWSGGASLTKGAAIKMLNDFFAYHDKTSAHDTAKYFRMSVRVDEGRDVRNRRTGEYSAGKPTKTVWIGA